MPKHIFRVTDHYGQRDPELQSIEVVAESAATWTVLAAGSIEYRKRIPKEGRDGLERQWWPSAEAATEAYLNLAFNRKLKADIAVDNANSILSKARFLAMQHGVNTGRVEAEAMS